MKTSQITVHSLMQSLAVVVYIGLVAWIMQPAKIWFGEMDNWWGPVTFLLLFVVSAAMVGLLVFDRALYWYFDGSKPAAVKLVLFTVAWLVVITVLILVGRAG